MADEKQAPHEPGYYLERASQMLKLADQATNEEDRQTFRALAEQWQRLAKLAERQHP